SDNTCVRELYEVNWCCTYSYWIVGGAEPTSILVSSTFFNEHERTSKFISQVHISSTSWCTGCINGIDTVFFWSCLILDQNSIASCKGYTVNYVCIFKV